MKLTLRLSWVFAAILAALGPAQAQQPTSMRMLVSWNPGLSIVDFPVGMIGRDIEADSQGKIKIMRQGPAVVSPFEQLEPASKGLFDLLFTGAPYHTNATGVGLIFDTVISDIEKRRESGAWAWADAYYQKQFNVKILAITAEKGYQFLLRDPVGADGGLAGRKIRSVPAYDDIIKALGGAPVQLAPGEVYTALEKGLVDGIAWPQHSVVTQKFNEVTKFYVRPTFGGANLMWLMNLDKWRTLSPEVQKLFADEGLKVEKAAFIESRKIAEAEDVAMAEKGMKPSALGASYAQQLETVFNKGVWERAAQRSGDDAKAFIALIQDKGLVRQQP